MFIRFWKSPLKVQKLQKLIKKYFKQSIMELLPNLLSLQKPRDPMNLMKDLLPQKENSNLIYGSTSQQSAT